MKLFYTKRVEQKKKATSRLGFSLFEVLVSVAIFTILTSSLIAKNANFRNHTLMTNLAYELGLVIRKAQAYGIGIRGSNSTTAVAAATKYYGVWLSSAFDTGVTLYRDENDSNGTYEIIGDSIVERFNFNADYKIQSFCVTDTANVQFCSNIAGGPTDLFITFKRPDPSAKLFFKRGGVTYIGNSAVITVTARKPNGPTASVTVNATGQISVQE